MKIAITSQGKDLESQMDQRFGRCPYFLIVDIGSMEFEAIENVSASLGQGAGIQSAQVIVGKGVEALVTGNCGPNAFSVLNASGVKVISGVSGSIREIAEKYKTGNLQSSVSPNVQGHFGLGQGGAENPGGGRGQSGGGRGGGAGRGMGGGGGRGMGRGK